MKILIIEDVYSIVEAITLVIEQRWPDTKIVSAAQGEKGIDMAKTESLDVIILDLGLPDMSGFEVLKRIRLFSDVPILILTVRSAEYDIVKGLEWGADDYMVKPFRNMELLARINGIMRKHSVKYENPLLCGQLRFEPDSFRVFFPEREIMVSFTEGIILGQLMRNAGNVVSYAILAEAMWGDDFPEARDSIHVHVRHLREKLEIDPSKPKLILNKPGIGYFLNMSS
jgi:two-component system KDP operon response regulator KdpE